MAKPASRSKKKVPSSSRSKKSKISSKRKKKATPARKKKKIVGEVVDPFPGDPFELPKPKTTRAKKQIVEVDPLSGSPFELPK